MITSEERFQVGQEVRALLGGGEEFVGSVPVAYELAPDMFRISTECLYGSIWSRPGLDMRYRALATLTALAVQGRDRQLRAFHHNALNLGLTPEEIVEALIQVGFYGGISASYNSLALTRGVFEERGIQFSPPGVFDTSVEPEARQSMGVAVHKELTPDIFGYYSVEPTQEEHDLDLLMNEYLWGAIWTRPGLDMKARIVCALAALVTQGRYDQYIRRMIEGGLRNGISREETMELFMHLAFYIGMLPARAAMNVANTVFRSPEFSASGSPGL